jgi:hypothetical protein
MHCTHDTTYKSFKHSTTTLETFGDHDPVALSSTVSGLLQIGTSTFITNRQTYSSKIPLVEFSGTLLPNIVNR